MNGRGKLNAIFLCTVFAGSTILAGCGSNSNTAAVIDHPDKNNTNGILRVLGGWPIPPQFQGNPFGSGGIGSAGNYGYDGLFTFIRSIDKVYNDLAESVDNSQSGETIVHLRRNAKWSDGQPFTSKDVWGYYTLNNGSELTNYLTGITTPDDYTVIFKWATPAPFDEMKMLFLAEDTQMIPYHYYKKWVDKAAAILAQAKPDTTPKDQGQTPYGLKITDTIKKQLSDNWNDFANHGPNIPIVDGPYMMKKVNATEMTLVKNPYYWNVSQVKFKEVDLKIINDLNQQYALLKAGQLDNYDGTQPRDILESILAANKNLVHYQVHDPACVGFLFNTAHKPFDNQTFRQAIIYALDRTKIRQVGNYYGTETELSGTGMPSSDVSKWVDPSILSHFTKYSYDTNKATQLLESIGWKKGADGIWKDSNGKSFNFVIASDQSWVPAVNSGETVAEQLTSFGLPTKYKAVDGSIYWGNVDNGKGTYDMSFDWVDVSWGFSFPWNAMRNTYWWNSWKHAHLPKNPNGESNFVAQGYDGQKIDVSTLLHQIPFMTSADDRKHAIDEIAYVTNQAAWEVNLFQNVTGTWLNDKTVGGLPWPDGIKKYNRDLPLPPANLNDNVVAHVWSPTQVNYGHGLLFPN